MIRQLPPSHGMPRLLELRRAERELFFWTAREWLKLIAWLALTLYFVIELIHGRFAGAELLNVLARGIPG